MNPRPGKSPDTAALIGKTRQKEQTPVTEYKLNRFTMADAQALAGKTADITEWDDDELETKVTYPGARVTGIIVLASPYLVIETAGAVITDARTGERLGTRPPDPELHVWSSPGSARSLTSAAGSSAATGSPLSTPTTRTPGSGPATREPSPATTRDPASSTSAGTAEAPCPCS